VVPATGRAYARAGLAGNPSDGYGGRTVAVVLREFAAEAQVDAAAADRCELPLARAALARFRREVADVGPVEVRWTTTVPREVGLAGSSAIVIAVLRALCAVTGASLESDALARMALAVETEDLGIAAGLQDRLVQAHEALLAVDFGAEPRVEALDEALLPGLFVAWRSDAAQASGVVHGELRTRWLAGDSLVCGVMEELAACAWAARDALLAGDRAAFAGCLDASLELRRRVMPVDERVLRMAEVARGFGAAVNSAGSGGAVVGTVPASWQELEAALRADGCGVQLVRG